MSFFGKKPTLDGTDHPPSSHDVNAGPGSHSGYGIDEAIRLMRRLPADQNVDLIVKVVKKTLESLNVKLGDILADATQKQQALGARIGGLQEEIAELEKQIAVRKEEIARLEGELSETTAVKERLALAEMASKAPPPPDELQLISVPQPPPLPGEKA
jgi:uncharacterized small protein (DUF1192 family)